MKTDVLHVVPAYHPARGGVEVLVENLAEGLREEYGITSAVVAPALPGERSPDYVHQGTRVYSVPVSTDAMATTDDALPRPLPPDKMLPLMSGIYANIRQIYRETSPSLVHIHAASTLLGATSIAATEGIPVVMHVHGTIHAGDPPNFRTKVRDAEWVIAVADAVADSIIRDCQRTGPIIVIRNGVVDPLATTVPSHPYSPSLAMVGRLSSEKGFDDGLRALAIVRERIPEVRVRLVGSGPMENRLHAVAAELGMLDGVDYFGRLENADALRVVAGSDLVLIPSREEGFSLVATEAALLRRPVLATTAGGLPETVIDGVTGVLVAPGDITQMADGVERLLLDGHRRSILGEHARARALDEFGMGRFVAEVAGLYDRIWRAGEDGQPEGRA